MSIRDLFVEIIMDIEDGPLADLDRRINQVISSITHMDFSGFNSMEDDLDGLIDDFDDLGDHIDDVDRELNNIDGDSLNDVERSANEADGAFGKLKGTIIGVGAAIGAYIAVDKIVEIGVSALESAATAKAMASQFEQVFAGMEDAATKALDKIATETGILPNRLKGSYIQMAAFAKTTGVDTAEALKLTERATLAAADSAAFYDRSIEDVTENLQSFLKGNFENDAALGISATETTRNAKATELYGKSFIKLSEAQKQLTLLAMVEDGNKLSGAIGQAARESDSWENQLGNLKSAWDGFLIKLGSPILDQAVAVMTKAGDVISNIDPGPFMEFVSAFFDKLASLKDVILTVYNTIMSLVYDTGEVSDLWQKLGVPAWVADGIEAYVTNIFMIKDVIMAVYNSIMSVFYDTGEVADIWENLGVPSDVADAIERFMQSFREGFDLAKSVLTNFIENVIVPLMPKAQEFVGTAMEYIGRIVKGAINIFETLKGIVTGLIENVIVPLFPVAQEVISVAMDIISPILRVAGSLFEGITAVIKFLVNEVIVPLFPLAVSSIEKAWGTLKPILSAISKAFNAIADAVEWVIKKLGSVGEAIQNFNVGDKISGVVSKVTSFLPGFEIGLGRVPYDEMPALLHKDEAVLPADEADKLRDRGILQGNGTDPEINLDQATQFEPARDYSATETVNNTSNNSKVSAPIQIIVQGSENPQETAYSVKDALEELFGDLLSVMPVPREG